MGRITINSGQTYFNVEMSQSCTKVCSDSDFTASPTIYTVPASTYSSAISQSDANSKAEADLMANCQSNADVFGICQRTRFWNVLKQGTFYKNNCNIGYDPNPYIYSIAAHTYSASSQAAADALAQAAVNSNGQAAANTSGTCTQVVYPFKWIPDESVAYCEQSETPPPVCPDRTLVFQICNSNSSRDDNFNVYLNENFIGTVILGSDAQVGSLFIASLGTPEVTSSDFVCPLNLMVTQYFDPAFVQGGLNTIRMENIQDNGNSNAGDVGIRNYLITEDGLASPCVVADLPFTGASGSDFNLEFDYTACCPEDEGE